MPNMSPIKNPMPSQAPDIRNKNFKICGEIPSFGKSKL